ncbi:MAG: DegV family protein [Lachnospiraceae bacterium]|nr:DegV family protein [Lachnospiraceae bacterium]
MTVAIVTDSNSGILGNEEWEKEVYVIPMPVILDGRTYYEGQDMPHEQFYKLLAEHKPISTSQPAPADILETWERILYLGYEKIVYIPMSSGLSGSCQTARMLADEYGGRVQVVDNHRISVTQKQSVKDALWLAEKGCTAEEIREELEKTAYDSIIYVGVETLEYLKKGGRITPAAAAMGTLLNLKPLLTIQGEKVDAYAKVRGSRACKKRLIEAMQKSADRFREQKIEISVGAASSFPDREGDLEWMGMVKEAFPGEEIHYDPLTFSIGCHVGPGAFGMGISRKIG